MTLDSEPSTLDPPNKGQVINCNDEIETTETLLKYYYNAKIGHNHPNLHIIRNQLKKNVKLYALASSYSTKPSFPIHQPIICSLQM